MTDVVHTGVLRRVSRCFCCVSQSSSNLRLHRSRAALRAPSGGPKRTRRQPSSSFSIKARQKRYAAAETRQPSASQNRRMLAPPPGSGWLAAPTAGVEAWRKRHTSTWRRKGVCGACRWQVWYVKIVLQTCRSLTDMGFVVVVCCLVVVAVCVFM